MNIKVKLLPSTRTDLPCVLCGCFLLNNSRKRHFAIVRPDAADDADASAGIHNECRAGMTVKRNKSPKKEAADV